MGLFLVASNFVSDGLVNNLYWRCKSGMWVDVMAHGASNKVRSTD